MMNMKASKQWKIEYAKTSRSSCRTCKKTISVEMLRLGKIVQASRYDGFLTLWNHTHCMLKKAGRIKFLDDVEGLDLLRWEDQRKMRRYIEGGVFFNTTTVGVNEFGIEVSQTSRAVCKLCNKKIAEGEVRISTRPNGEKTKILAWHHASCYLEWLPSTQVEKLLGWNSFSVADQKAVSALAKKDELQEEDELLQTAPKKRKRSVRGNQKLKICKTEENESVSMVANESNLSDLTIQSRNNSSYLENLESQNKALWGIIDDLKTHVTIVEMREMLDLNGQHPAGSELDLRSLCADGMLFGALASCPICSGSLRYSGTEYRCHGYVSAWSKCSYSTTKPIRLKGKWEIPDETRNAYLSKWFKSQKGQKPIRIPPALFQGQASGTQAALKDLKVAVAGFSEECRVDWKNKIERHGGIFDPKIRKDTTCLVVSSDLDHKDFQITRARILGLPILRVDYLVDCTEMQKILPFTQYIIEPINQSFRSTLTVQVKGKCAVHESSGLKDYCHILEDGKTIYSTTLSKSDLSLGVNSYYILQIIEDDKRPNIYLFREWGRVGNDQIGGNKLDNMSKTGAIQEFKRLFLEKTGNHFEAWEMKENFQKQPGRFFPLDIDYGVNKEVFKKKDPDNSKSQLAPQLVKLMEMLFDVEAYRSAMMELEIDMCQMPLGRLSKTNIQKGFEALTEIENILNSNNQNIAIGESLLIDASNRFFTIIPSTHPHIIRDENDFRSKVKLLEDLQEIEIACRLVGFDDGNANESIDDKYKKLHCDITPLSHDSDDYLLVEKYLRITHASTHKDWFLELEDVFTLEREGELDKFVPYKQNLENKMLLWHGSRLTNFVGILSQGLRIAPPEAPSTGYMFGKGIYFADLVSKSAQYCRTDRRNQVGLMLLSEVALGDVYEVKNASYMEKPPQEKNSTKGLGRKIPRKSEFVTWRNQVTVPCGKPISSNVKISQLMYNEYVVYDTAQDYGVNKEVFKKEDPDNSKSQLALQLVKLMEMLFDVEAYRSTMMELEIDMSQMPLGNLSKTNVQMGFEALTEIENILNSNYHQDISIRESLLIDASNLFFTIIPSTHPHVIRDQNDFRSKVKLLEDLQDIEIASRLVGFDDGNANESIDDKYKKLHCDITPLPHDSDEYLLVEKYLRTTHASTHKDWFLELEDVFALEREGELDKFAPYKQNLQNKMLLWRGSRLTNFVGILSQGLRIAPPEAPSTGYMFGKGIYFADLVSKSAQYCRTDRRNPVGLMLLSEVALGDVYEVKNASYMEKPPQGKNSTKGLGRKIPRKSEFVTWRNQVTVPCGKPISSNVKISQLMYNEYVVYDTAQVKMQFLLKVRFHHRR